MSKSEVIAHDVIRVPTGISNAYIVGTAQRWVLIDSGTPGNASNILTAAEQHLGPNATPLAIVLTHGHFDHAGSASELAQHWGVEVFVHHREMPFVDGTSHYPPPDPTVGGLMAQITRFVPTTRIDLTPHVRKLDLASGELPWAPGWLIIETPGHTAGHVSFFRPADSTLIAGDAFTTMNQDNIVGMISKRQQVRRPPAAFTPDWKAAEESVRLLASLNPRVLAAGHGVPMEGYDALAQLRDLARHFPLPRYGRYIPDPVRYDDRGIAYLPSPVPDPLKRTLGIIGVTTVSLGIGYWLSRRVGEKQKKGITRIHRVA